MAFFVLIVSATFLSSLVIVDPRTLQLILLLLFFAVGLLVRYRLFTAYLIFIFLYPLLPSQPEQIGLPAYNLYEFLFLCLAFWWAVVKIRTGVFRFPSHPFRSILFCLILAFTVSAFLALLRNHLILSEVFLLKLRDDWNIFSPPNTWDHLEAWRSLIYFLQAILLFFITIDILDTPEKIQKTVRAIFISAMFVSVIGILQYAFKYQILEFWVKENPNLARINSTFSDPNALGSYLAAMLCLGTFTYLSDFPSSGKWNSVFVCLILTGLIFTASRAAWGAAFLALFAFPAVGRLSGIDFSRNLRGVCYWITKRGIYIAVLPVAILVLVAFFANVRADQPKSLFQLVLFSFNPRLPLDEILKGRMEWWQAAYRVFRDSPIFGCGTGTLIDLLRHSPYYAVEPQNAHNYFFQLLAENGFIGFILFGLVIFGTLSCGIKKLKTAVKQEFLITYGVFSGIVAFLFTCLTGHPLLVLKLQFVFWTLLAILVAQNSRVEFHLGRYFAWIAIVIAGIFLPFQIRSILNSRQIPAYEYGYYDWEQVSHEIPFRWTKEEAISLLEVHGRVLDFQLRQLNPAVVKKPSEVKIFLGNQLLDTITLTDTSWKEARYFLGDLKETDRISLRIQSDSLFVPGKDGRALGIALRPFSWSCSLEAQPSGIYEREQDGSRAFVWTRHQASFPLQQAGSNLRFFVMPNPSVSTAPLEVTFYWNEQLVKKTLFNNQKWEPVDLTIPQTGDPKGVLTIHVSETWNPKSKGDSYDSRDLGLKVAEPFEWQAGAPIKFAEFRRKEQLEDPMIYGISNNGNRPFNLVLFPVNDFGKGLHVEENGKPLIFRSGLYNSVSTTKQSWIRIYPPDSARSETFLVSGPTKFEESMHLSAGNILLRMTASGTSALAQVPVAGISINGREVARQPIFSEEWRDYYFNLQSRTEVKKIAVDLLNDYDNPQDGSDRNIFINEIVAFSKQTRSNDLKSGWEFLPDSKDLIYNGSLPLSSNSDSFSIDRDWGSHTVSLNLTAHAELAGNESPRLAIYVDHMKRGTVEIRETNWRNYTLKDIVPAGTHHVQILFENDYRSSEKGMDKVYIEKISAYPRNMIMVAEPVPDFPFPQNTCYTVKEASSSH